MVISPTVPAPRTDQNNLTASPMVPAKGQPKDMVSDAACAASLRAQLEQECDVDDMIPDARRAFSTDPSVVNACTLTHLLLRSRMRTDHEEAVRILSPMATRLERSVLQSKRDPAAAGAASGDVAALRDVRYHLGLAYLLLGDHSDGLAVAEALCRDHPTSHQSRGLRVLLREGYRRDAAIGAAGVLAAVAAGVGLAITVGVSLARSRR
eukprot:TRINITY_DN34960_c0_g1_i1.p1 TRINITY_DN34960_c0_g1~~TRINITY_DN34960_c0_g1_i1.p1  ORF type:complete len:209 (+),score=23.26 TRINITY_DN34960_c0_g1_i1:131-757(+)